MLFTHHLCQDRTPTPTPTPPNLGLNGANRGLQCSLKVIIAPGSFPAWLLVSRQLKFETVALPFFKGRWDRNAPPPTPPSIRTEYF